MIILLISKSSNFIKNFLLKLNLLTVSFNCSKSNGVLFHLVQHTFVRLDSLFVTSITIIMKYSLTISQTSLFMQSITQFFVTLTYLHTVFTLTSSCFNLRTEQEELLREMSEKASRPTPEVYMLQKELEKARSHLRQEQVLGDHEKYQSTNRLHEEIDRNKGMVRKFEEQTLQQREMNREMSDLRQQLFHFKQGAKSFPHRHIRVQYRCSYLCCY